MTMPRFGVVVASNDRQVLETCLLASPAIGPDIEVTVERSARSAALAYNAGRSKSSADVIVYVHQDVLLPAGWFDRLAETIESLDRDDPSWGVLGALGVDVSGISQGSVYSTGLRALVGRRPARPVRVRTLDEVVLVMRRSSPLTFDEKLPGFHLYGTDICLAAARVGLSSYAIDAGCIHNSNGIRILPSAYWRSWLYVRRKWKDDLPVKTPCMSITSSGGAAFRYLLTRPIRLLWTRTKAGERVNDPRTLLGMLSTSDK